MVSPGNSSAASRQGAEKQLEASLEVFELERITIAMSSLPERQQTLIWYAEVMGKTPGEIASLLCIDEHSVVEHVVLARKALRLAFEWKELVDDPLRRSQLEGEQL